MTPFYGWGSTASRLQSHFEETVYFLQPSSQKVLVLIWSTSERSNENQDFLGTWLLKVKCLLEVALNVLSVFDVSFV